MQQINLQILFCCLFFQRELLFFEIFILHVGLTADFEFLFLIVLPCQLHIALCLTLIWPKNLKHERCLDCVSLGTCLHLSSYLCALKLYLWFWQWVWLETDSWASVRSSNLQPGLACSGAWWCLHWLYLSSIWNSNPLSWWLLLFLWWHWMTMIQKTGSYWGPLGSQ